MSDLTAQEILDEIRGRLMDLEDERLLCEATPTDRKQKLSTRHIALQELLSWITGQNQLMSEEKEEPTDDDYRSAARTYIFNTRNLEVEPDAKVNRGPDGAMVQSWTFVARIGSKVYFGPE